MYAYKYRTLQASHNYAAPGHPTYAFGVQLLTCRKKGREREGGTPILASVQYFRAVRKIIGYYTALGS